MHVAATAGHVDHGKSTLVRALTGTDPDRLAEEHRRGLSIELGHAHLDLPSGARLALVDVPGHQRFLATMLAGVGAVPATLLVVAADEGWSAQTAEHVAAIDALGVSHAVLIVTKADRADPGPVAADSVRRLAGTSLDGCPWVGVSASTGQGLPELRAALDVLVRTLPPPPDPGRVRLFVDRVFTVRGAGTVVTGTLPAGTVRVGDALELDGREVRVRALQCCHEQVTEAHGVARVALNLRGVGHDQIGRGAALLSPDAWHLTTSADVRLTAAGELPRELVLHVGGAAVPVAVRRLEAHTRLTWRTPLPLAPGDRGVLRDPGRHTIAAGVVVVDADPPSLAGRGRAATRAAALPGWGARQVLARAGALPAAALRRRGWSVPPAAVTVGDWVVDPDQWARWSRDLTDGVPALPDPALLAPLTRAAGWPAPTGRALAAQRTPPALAEVWAAGPFEAPTGEMLAAASLDAPSLARLAAAGLALRLPGDVVLSPGADDRALAVLAALAQPFSLGEAKTALGVSRRVAVPLLEHLDRQRRTRRDGDSRWVR
jgi:selenocysteine-specific elongation factor